MLSGCRTNAGPTVSERIGFDMKTALLILTLGGLLAFAIGVSVYVWWQLEDVELGIYGTIALILGIVFTLATGVGLMRLMYYSHQHGHDDNIR